MESFILSLICCYCIFCFKNGDKVLIDFIFTKVEVSQAIVIFLSAILGAVVVAILSGVKNIKYKKEIRDLNKELQSLKEEKNNMQVLLEDRGEEIAKLKKSIKELEQKIEEFNNSIEGNGIEIES